MDKLEPKPKGKLCICGHNHISYVGDLGIYHDRPGWDKIPECEKCNCENYKQKEDDINGK